MDIDELEKVVKLLCDSGATEFELEQGETKLHVKRGVAASGEGIVLPVQTTAAIPVAAPVSASSPQEDDEGLEKVNSPIVGTFYRKPSPEADVFVQEGDRVSKGDTLCIIEAMKLMNEIESPCSGTIRKILLSDGQVVEFGETLFLIDAS